MNLNTLTAALSSATKLGSILTVIIPVICLVMALLQCFFGYKLVRFWISLFGFLIGFLLGFFISAHFMGEMGLVQVLIGAGAGVIFGLLAYKIYLAGVFVFCFVLAFAAMACIPWPADDLWNVLSVIICIAVGVLAGVLAVRFSRPLLILITGICGAWNAMNAAMTIWPQLPLQDQNIRLIITALVALVGVLVQFLTTRNSRR